MSNEMKRIVCLAMVVAGVSSGCGDVAQGEHSPDGYSDEYAGLAAAEGVGTLGQAVTAMQDVEAYHGTWESLVDRVQGATGLRWTVGSSRNSCGTGTLISPDLFLTVYRTHCNYQPGYTVAFNYQRDESGNLRTREEFEITEWVDEGRRSDGYDYSIVRLAGSPGLKYGWVRPAMYEPPVGSPAIMIHHEGKDPKQVSIGKFISGAGFASRLRYEIDSDKGASGSGVLDQNGRLVAVNNAGNPDADWAEGVSMKSILEFSPVADEILRFASPCSGRTKPGDTDWVNYTSTGIYVDIDTSKCGFGSTPLYFTSLGGRASHWLSRGGTSIYDAGKTKFRVYIKYPWGIDPAEANDLDWHINWEAVPRDYRQSSLCTGRTATTGWKASGSDKVYIDVDTSACGFSSRPIYLTSLSGDSGHWDSVGTTAIHNVAADKFRVYVRRDGITPQAAEDWGWRINWRAEQRKSDSIGKTTHACVGEDYSEWKQYGSSDLYIDVDTSNCELPPHVGDPLAFFSIRGRNHSGLDGLTAVYDPDESGFRIFVSADSALTPQDAIDDVWRVNWRLREQVR